MVKLKYNSRDAVFVALLIVNVALAIMTAQMAYRMTVLTRVADEQSKMSLMFNARANNTRECLRQRDYECPENKYFDSRKFVE